jgi:hypothetical protein
MSVSYLLNYTKLRYVQNIFHGFNRYVRYHAIILIIGCIVFRRCNSIYFKFTISTYCLNAELI